MARCGECFELETACACRSSCVITDARGRRYLNREVAAAAALGGSLGVFLVIGVLMLLLSGSH